MNVVNVVKVMQEEDTTNVRKQLNDPVNIDVRKNCVFKRGTYVLNINSKEKR